MLSRAHLRNARSMLFVPGSRPDRFSRATASGADVMIVDLEDAVLPEQKVAAREHVHEWLGTGRHAIVRINGIGTPWFAEDIAMVREHECPVMVPKVEREDDLAEVVAMLADGTDVVALIESAAGLRRSHRLLSTAGVVRAALGTADLALQLNIDSEDTLAMLHHRSTVVRASAEAGCAPPLDGVVTVLSDDSLLLSRSRHAAQMGFTGMLCIHPSQVGTVNEVMTPDAVAVEHARRVVAAAGEGATVIDGRFVDEPVIARARRLVDRAETLSSLG